MSRWYEHPCTGKLLEGEQILNVLSYINEAKDAFKATYGDVSGKEAPLEQILQMWPDKSSVRKEWLRKVIDNGPMNDKMQSMVTVISNFPMHSFFYLDHLISLVNQNKKRFAITASELLADIFVKFLLPKTRPLLNMKERHLSSLDNLDNNNEKKLKKGKGGISVRSKILSFWYYEEQLKTRYFRFLRAMEEMLKNETDKANKLKMINLFARLCECKESQSVIVEILVNKLGDTDRKVIGAALSKLENLEKNHKSLTPIIVRTIRKFVFRPNLSTSAQYYAMQLLARTQFDASRLETAPMEADDDPELHTTSLPIEVIQIYIGVLKRLLEASKTKCEKLYSALMCGISRAMPYAKDADVTKYTNTIFKLVHSSNLNLSIQGLKVLFAIVSSQKSTGDNQTHFDRYQRLVYRTLINPAILFYSQKTKLVEIFFKSVAIDEDLSRAKAMIKRLLQLCIQSGDPGFICVSLLFLSRLIKSKLNPIFKIKATINPINTDLKMPTIAMSTVTEEINDDSADEDEIVPDIVSDDEMEEEKKDREGEEDKEDKEEKEDREGEEDKEEKEDKEEMVKGTAASSWVHADNIKVNHKTIYYDPFSIDPKFCNVDKEELVELRLLKKHSHPSVQLFVDKILKMEPIDYKSDPSEDFSLSKFLDRFAFRNPKETKDKRKTMPGSSRLVTDPARKMAINTKQYADLSEANIPIDELFFHKYFNHSKKTSKAASGADQIDEDFQDSDTEFDALLEKVENNSEDDSFSVTASDMDDDFSDFEDDEDEDEDFGDGEDAGMDFGGEEDEPMDFDNESMEGDEDNEEEEGGEESSEEETTMHSSKRRKLGNEMASITTGAMLAGNAFEKVQTNYENKRKLDRKKRKGKKEKKEKKEPQAKVKKPKNLKRKMKK